MGVTPMDIYAWRHPLSWHYLHGPFPNHWNLWVPSRIKKPFHCLPTNIENHKKPLFSRESLIYKFLKACSFFSAVGLQWTGLAMFSLQASFAVKNRYACKGSGCWVQVWSHVTLSGWKATAKHDSWGRMSRHQSEAWLPTSLVTQFIGNPKCSLFELPEHHPATPRNRGKA